MSQISSKYMQRFERRSRKCVNQNHKYRSQGHNLNKLENRPPEDSPNQI